MNMKILKNIKSKKCDYANSKALYVLKIVTMSFAILACVVVATAMLTRWIMDLNQKVKESQTKVAKAAARISKFRKSRIKHILKQRKLQLKEEKEEKKGKKNKNRREPAKECGCETAADGFGGGPGDVITGE